MKRECDRDEHGISYTLTEEENNDFKQKLVAYITATNQPILPIKYTLIYIEGVEHHRYSIWDNATWRDGIDLMVGYEKPFYHRRLVEGEKEEFSKDVTDSPYTFCCLYTDNYGWWVDETPQEELTSRLIKLREINKSNYGGITQFILDGLQKD
jgi:hypothetical protein